MFSIIRIAVFLCFIISFIVLVMGNGLTPIKRNIAYSRDNEILPFSERMLRKTFDHDKVKQLNKITPFAENDIGYRLPNTTKPELYTISIVTRIDKNSFNFEGLVRINIVALENTTEIILHSRQLSILSSTIAKMSDPARPIPIGMVLTDSVKDFLTIRLAAGNVLEAGERYFIEIFYIGILREDDAGFYRSSYVNEDGVTVFLATTQFESTDARHGFPCYDEPAYKALFNLAITHGENYTAISNSNVQSVVTNFGLETKTTTFEQTPLMSTYLIAFVISDFSSIQRTASGVTHRSFARPNAAHLIQLTLDTSVSTLRALEEYLNINYTLSKMDQIGVPDFAAGAMENWGLVTYRESYFLFDENVDSYRTKTGIVTVIAHEYAHQWFGNLVTPEWWTHIWLNEGFATLFEYFATDMIHPDWNMVDYFVVDVLQNVFNIDASESIRPMTHYVESPTDIDKLFDAIAYDKSGSVLRMIQNAISDATFRKGLNYYLVDRSFASANEEHLIVGLQKAISEDEAIPKEINVYDIMLSWSHQSGFPLLHVSRNYADNSIRIYQERYLNNNPITTENKSTWWIPYNFVTASKPEFTNTKADDWLPQYARSKTIVPTTAQNWTTNDWIIFNKQQTGYYRILYDTINYGLIADELYYGNHARIHYLNRAQLIDDAFTFARTNRLDWTIPFDIIKYLRKEIEYPPWRSFTNHLTYLQRFMPGLNNYPYYKQFMVDAFENLFSHTGIDDISDEPMLLKYKRTLAINWACYFGSEICLQQANEKLNNLLNNGIQIHPNLQSVVYCAGARGGGTFLPLYNKFIVTTGSTERRNFISAMSCLPNESDLKQLLELTQETENINFNSISERVYVINSVSENSELGLLVSIQFLIDNNATVVQYFGRNNLVNIVYNMAYLASTNNLRLKINELVEILLSNDSITMTTANEANAVIFDNMKWHIFNGQTIDNWLSNIGFDDVTTTVVNDETTVDEETTLTTTEVTDITTPSGSSKFNVNMITIFILFGFQLYLTNY